PRPHPRERPRPPLRDGVRERRGRAREACTARGGPAVPAGAARIAGARREPPPRAGSNVTIATALPTGDADVIELAERFRADLPLAVRPALEQALDAHAAALGAELQAFGRAAAAAIAVLAHAGEEEAPPAGAHLIARIRAIDEARLAIAQQAL